MVGFGRKWQKSGRKQGLVEKAAYSGYSRYSHYRCYWHPKPTISPAQQHPQKTSNKYFKTENIFVNLRKNF
jgi:hypothetical protein